MRALASQVHTLLHELASTVSTQAAEAAEQLRGFGLPGDLEACMQEDKHLPDHTKSKVVAAKSVADATTLHTVRNGSFCTHAGRRRLRTPSMLHAPPACCTRSRRAGRFSARDQLAPHARAHGTVRAAAVRAAAVRVTRRSSAPSARASMTSWPRCWRS